MTNRIHDLERAVDSSAGRGAATLPSRKRTAKNASSARPSGVGPNAEAAAPAPRSGGGAVSAIAYSMSFDTGRPIVIRKPASAQRPRAASMSTDTGARSWRDVGAVSEAGFAEQLEDYDEGASPVAATPNGSNEPSAARLVTQEDPPADAEESRAFAAEIERLLAQAKGSPAPTSTSLAASARAPSRAEEQPAAQAQPQPQRGAYDLPPDHPHRIFDQMSFATAFDGGTIDLDTVERDAAPRPRKRPVEKRIESFDAAGALEAIDVAEDLALIRAQNTTKHYDVASDAVITADIEERIAPVADAYFSATGKNITITSGARTPRKQAQAMYDKLQSGGSLSIYKNQTAAAEIKKAYDDAKARGDTESQIVDAMCTVLQRQVDAGTFISRHLFAGAVDVRKRDMSSAEIAAFESAVRAAKNVSLLDEGKPPHFHLEFR